MAVDARRDPETATGAIKRIADRLGIHPEALRGWVKQAEVDAGHRPGTTTSDVLPHDIARGGRGRERHSPHGFRNCPRVPT
ncbi:MAG: transposase [Actinophytocola sp.]|uniref:transposase n=1 Tax=Actinophytocola sp. TaxID=1872138 RepID=UPI001324FC1B|nr:transposase [Actinophytocola sp.]